MEAGQGPFKACRDTCRDSVAIVRKASAVFRPLLQIRREERAGPRSAVKTAETIRLAQVRRLELPERFGGTLELEGGEIFQRPI
jgi:hypothetical protein